LTIGLTSTRDPFALDAAARALLADRCERAVRRARRAGGEVLAALTVALDAAVDPSAVVFASRRAGEDWFCYEQPARGGAAVAALGASHSLALTLVLALVGGFFGVLFVGLSTVVVQAMSTDEIRARAIAIWAAAFVGMLPFGALVTAGLTAWLGPGGAVFVDGAAVLAGAALVVAVRPQVAWLGCAALPETCVAGIDPAAVAAAAEVEREPVLTAA
jgi:hypothetical protein